MFETLASSFGSIANKIRFNDDERSLSKALDELKKLLLKNDVHHKVTKELLRKVELSTKNMGIGKSNFLKALEESLKEILTTNKNYGFTYAQKPPTTVMMVGLQGSGKTTTSAKLANYLKTKNKKVLLAPCDLQRLAAVEQLKQLASQIEVDIYLSDRETPQEVAQEAKNKAMAEHYDVLIIDTAGRLAIDEALMKELEEMKDLVTPDEIFYVADSLSGQDGLRSASEFNEKIGISGVVLSKFDSDSKGGIALSIAYQLGIPIRFIGSGEKVADIDIFLPDRIVSRLMGAGDIESLVEKTSSVFTKEETKDLTKKIKKGQFNIDDFISQIENIKKLGNLGSLMGMIPGFGNMASSLKNIDLENSSEIKNIKAMSNSMTKKERQNPDILDGSRKKRISIGCGLDVSDINRILKQFNNASKMAKKMSNKGGMQDIMSMLGQRNNTLVR